MDQPVRPDAAALKRALRLYLVTDQDDGRVLRVSPEG